MKHADVRIRQGLSGCKPQLVVMTGRTGKLRVTGEFRVEKEFSAQFRFFSVKFQRWQRANARGLNGLSQHKSNHNNSNHT